jgi:protein-tyrosine phosphatase
MSFQAALQRRKQIESGEIWASKLTNWLYLGSGRNAQNLDKLQENSITHILNVADDVPNFHEKYANIEYCNLRVKDFGEDAGISRTFRLAEEFVKQAICESQETETLLRDTSGDSDSADSMLMGITNAMESVSVNHSRVLIHCANGSNRSATVAIALIMLLAKVSLRNAVNFVKTKHPSSLPLRDNCLQLQQFEQRLRKQKPTSLAEEQIASIFLSARTSTDGNKPCATNSSSDSRQTCNSACISGSGRDDKEELQMPLCLKYSNMLALKIPHEAGHARMVRDGISRAAISMFFSGSV